MNRKSLVVIAMCGLLVAVAIFGAYQIGVNSGFSKGYTNGHLSGYNDGYANGVSQGSRFSNRQNTTTTGAG